MPGEHVALRARAPVAEVRLVELPAVALGAAGIAEEHAHPVGREELELEHRRPAVQVCGPPWISVTSGAMPDIRPRRADGDARAPCRSPSSSPTAAGAQVPALDPAARRR